MISALRDHLAWLFQPGRFLFGPRKPSFFRVRGFETIAFIDDPAEVAAVNKATGEMFLGGAGNEFLVALLGHQSAFTLDGEGHRLARRVVGTTLTNRAMLERQPEIDAIIVEEIALWQKQGRKDVGAWSRWLTMRILCKIVMDVEDPQQVRRIYSRLEATTGYLANIVSYCKPFWKPKGPVSVGHYVAYLVRNLDREIHAAIAQARSKPSATTALGALVGGQAEHGYDDAFIRDNMVALLAAGYDTTGASLSWALFWLGREGKAPDTSSEAFRSEVLRYCPPVEILPRRVSPGQLGEACAMLPSLQAAVDAGDTVGPLVSPCVHRIHHNPDIYPEPERFDPNRFADQGRRSPNEFLPFGAGGRMCLGINLGKLILDRVIENLEHAGLRVVTSSRRFSPVRRNVSIWPGWVLRARLEPLVQE